MKKYVLPVLSFALGYVLLYFFYPEIKDSNNFLEIRAEIPHCDRVESFINLNFTEPVSAESAYCASGDPALQSYRFSLKGLTELTYMRFDPSNLPNIKIRIHEVRVMHGEDLLKSFKPKELVNWASRNADISYDESQDVLEVQSKGDAYLFNDVDVKLPVSLATYFQKLEGRVYLLLSLAFLCLLPFFRGRDLFLLGLKCYLLLFYALPYLKKVVKKLSPLSQKYQEVAQGIGHCNYLGIVKQQETIYFFFALLLSLLAGCLWAIAFKLLGRRRTDFSEPASEGLKKFSPLFVVCVLLYIGVTVFPDVDLMFRNAKYTNFSAGFDAQNFSSWNYFLYQGFAPMRDFFYPYSGLSHLSLGITPVEKSTVFFSFLHYFLVYSLFFITCYLLSGFSKIFSLGSFLLFYILAEIKLFDRVDRYALSANLLLLLISALQTNSRFLWALLGCYFSYCFFIEPAQLIYSIPSAGIVLLWQLLQSGPKDFFKTQAKGILICLSSFIPSLALLVLYLWRKGEISEILNFYRGLSATAISSSSPTNYLAWLNKPESKDEFLNWSILALCFLCSVFYLSYYRRIRSVAQLTPLALLVLSIVLFQKQLLRPHIAFQIFYAPALGLVFSGLYFYQLNARLLRNKFYLPIPSLAFGIVFFFFIFSYRDAYHESFISRERDKVLGFVKNVSLFLFEEKAWEEAQALTFAKDNFSVLGAPGAVKGRQIASELESLLELKPEDNIFVLGDDSYFYVLLDKAFPFYLSLYDQSVISKQSQTVEWLKEKQVEYVIWRSAFKEFDSVPNVLRTPLIYSYVVNNYSPFKTYGEFLLLKKSASGVNLDFWAEQLSSSLNLGYLPFIAALKESTSTDAAEVTVEADIINLNLSTTSEGSSYAIEFLIEGKKFTATFNLKSGEHPYRIYLNRLWFYDLARKKALKVELLNPQGLKIKTERISKDILY